MWSRADILGLFSSNVVSFSRNVVLRGLLFSLNSVLKPRMLSVRAVYVLSSLLTYDENDGFFDHVPPPTVPQSRAQGLSTVDTADEIFPGTAELPSGPYGMGVRVPMLVISPWSKGG